MSKADGRELRVDKSKLGSRSVDQTSLCRASTSYDRSRLITSERMGRTNERSERARCEALPFPHASALQLGSKLYHLLPMANTIAEGSLESRRLDSLNAETLNK
jgi:hypothetical protein